MNDFLFISLSDGVIVRISVNFRTCFWVWARNNNLRRCLFNAISQAFFWFLAYACFALAFWYGTGLVLEERALPIDQITYSPGNMISVFFSTLSGSIALGSTGPFLEVFGMAKGAAKDVFAVLESKPLMHENKDSGKKPNFKTNISFRNVDFCYPSRPDVQVLKNVNVEIVFGDTVALVGHSGSGKSTVVQLLQRFYDPDAGSVSIDNVDLKEVNISYLRQNVGVVSQEPALFATTIAENIRFGKLNATKEEIINAAKIANAHKFIKSLPNGYETIIGARGTQLSGGQKQRVAIARALIKEPNLLILDEATSALDTESEAEVQTTLDSISRVCTKVIVAHRLSTIRNANRIIVFSNGIIVEEGSHESLMESKGVYYNMIESQGYTDISAHSKSKELTKQRAKSIASSVEEQEHKKLDDEFEAEKLEEKKGNLGVMLKILSANKPEWFSMLMGSIASVLNGASLPLYGLVFGNILGVLSLTDEVIVRQLSITYSLQFFYLGILSGVCMFLQIYAFSYSGEQLTYRLRNMMFDSMLKQEIGWFDRKENAVGALCAQLSGDAASVQGAGGSRIGIIINSLATVILSFVFGLYLEWRLALIAGSFFPLVLFSLYYETKSMQSGSSKTQKLLQKSAKVAVEAIENIRTVKSLGCENVFNGAYLKELVTCKKMAIRKCHFRGVILGLARSLVSFAYAPGLWFGVRLVTSNQVDNATVFKVLEVVITGSMSIGTALSFSSNMQKGLSAAARIFGLFNREPLIKSPLNPIDLKLGDGHVEYSRLYFAYPTRPTIQILNGLNLSVLKGKTVALVGSSGCGKSTLIQLLERFYDPTSGDIEIDDNDIKSADLKSLRCHLGIVSQEPNLFDKTIAENIAYGDNERAVEMHEIESAAKAANIHNFIVSLPLGYETRLGSKGTQLSGGQKQRIAIARALLRNPKILLLDEATSALDNESEKVVQQALDNARKGRTCITIAHRLTTVQDADLICVLKDGIVSEMGTHTELLSRQGLYYEYYKLQSGQF
ncbi:ATP-dependent translocase ABCB1-like isoform X2 [Cylas formicarius]|uniref:ATP-dependent translocase ABCB1-like isoform X2 n=1 Tax=Cylas formicarius TaxID=197179 RepID=UPI0029586B3F|nr:ATP-dependent translocase ABCB1-like isoform X2 [Cylas formicarius]